MMKQVTKLKRCTRCVMPETWADIQYDETGVCNFCREGDKLNAINWEERQRWLWEILLKYRHYAELKDNKYNCLVGYSGGKDTAYTLWAAVKKYGLTPLVVTFDHGFSMSPEGEWDLMEIPKLLNCDHLRFTIGNGLRNALCRRGTELIGDFCVHCHAGVGAFPARISKLFDVPLQIWGEPTAMYQTSGSTYKLEDMEEQDKEHFEKIFQAGLTPEKILPPGYKSTDLLPFQWPESEFPLKAIYLGNFETWNQREHVEIIKRELGWRDYPKEETWCSWDKNDCPHEALREFQKYTKLGFGKASFQASKDIRDGLITREEGMRLVEKYEGKRPSHLAELLKEIGMNEEEFVTITRRHAKNP